MRQEHDDPEIELPPPPEWVKLLHSSSMQQALNARTTLVQTHNWANTLFLGVISAALALGADTIEFPTPHGVAALALLLVALIRFLIRACIESMLLRKHFVICHHIEFEMLQERPDWGRIVADHRRLVTENRPVIEFLPLLWKTTRQAFLWPALVICALMIWGILALPYHPIIFVSVGFAAVVTAVEFVWSYAYLKGSG